ncbi:unnamed protein product [Alopecurus aequalis]
MPIVLASLSPLDSAATPCSSLDAEDRTRLLVNTATGRVLRKDLPMLRRYHLVTTTAGGFFVLAAREPPHAACILNPLTGHLIHFTAPMVTDGVDAAAVYGPAAALTLAMFCDSCRKLYTATPDSGCFDTYEDGNERYPFMRLVVLGTIYTGDDVLSEILDLMLQHGIEVFRMNADSRGVFEPAKSIGNRAIFLGYRTCVSVDVDKFPSAHANCIYYLKLGFLEDANPSDIYMYDLGDEKVSGAIKAINCVFLLDAEPPFTILQLLSSYTINAGDSELQGQKMFEGLPDVVPDVEASGLSAYLEDLEFDD